MTVTVLYSTAVTASGGRDGHVWTADDSLDTRLSMPRELGGKGGPGTNPEQLFAAGYAACFIGAMKLAASQAGKAVPAGATVTARVGIGPRAAGGFGITAELTVRLPGLDREEATCLVAQAHQLSPYSNATRGNVDVRLRLA